MFMLFYLLCFQLSVFGQIPRFLNYEKSFPWVKLGKDLGLKQIKTTKVNKAFKIQPYFFLTYFSIILV